MILLPCAAAPAMAAAAAAAQPPRQEGNEGGAAEAGAPPSGGPKLRQAHIDALLPCASRRAVGKAAAKALSKLAQPAGAAALLPKLPKQRHHTALRVTPCMQARCMPRVSAGDSQMSSEVMWVSWATPCRRAQG
jgi:hypothetical protein